MTQIDPNQRLNVHLSEGTEELRSHVQANIYSGNAREIDRVTKYYLYWKFYEGLHYKEFNDNMLSFNYIRAFIDKIIQFLLGDKCFSFKVTSLYNDVVDENLERNAENLLLYNWRKNNHFVLAHEILQMGSITGDCWVSVNWDVENKHAVIKCLDSRHSFPEFENGDFNKLSAFTTRQALDKNPMGYKVFVTRYTKESFETWYQRTPNEKIEQVEKLEYTNTPNSLGFIPIVHIKNKPYSPGYYSKSDSQDILKINKVYNELNQELKSIIDYHVSPTTIITGATTKNMQRGIGNVWSGLPPEANVFNLGLDVDLSAATQFVQLLKTSMHEISDVPENVLGKIQAISGTSAAALKLTYQPLVQQADLKAMTYGDGITQINEQILRYYKIYYPDNKYFSQLPIEFLEEFRAEPVFSYGFPTDTMIQLQEAQMELSLGITSRKKIMNDLGFNNVPDLLKQIAQEKEDDFKQQSQLQLQYGQQPMLPQNTPNQDLNPPA